MRKETLLVVAFLAIVLGTSGLIWVFALPDLRPMNFQHVASATLTTGPERQQRVLSADEVTALDQWLHAHEHGWGPLTTKTPSTGDAILHIVPQQGEAYTITLWTGVSSADWNDTAVVQSSPTAPFRLHAFEDEDFDVMRRLVQQQPYRRSLAP